MDNFQETPAASRRSGTGFHPQISRKRHRLDVLGELYELNPDETKMLAVSVSEKEFIGLYVQGIDEDLVAGYKLTGVYPAELTNINAEKEILKTSLAPQPDSLL